MIEILQRDFEYFDELIEAIISASCTVGETKMSNGIGSIEEIGVQRMLNQQQQRIMSMNEAMSSSLVKMSESIDRYFHAWGQHSQELAGETFPCNVEDMNEDIAPEYQEAENRYASAMKEEAKRLRFDYQQIVSEYMIESQKMIEAAIREIARRNNITHVLGEKAELQLLDNEF